MKNLLIGFMLGMWAKPIIEEVARKLNEERAAQKD